MTTQSPVVPAPLPHAWSSSALLAKAQRYAEEMMRHPPDDWRFVLWSTLSLELLARAALAHISPTLLADAKDWNNVYFALGKTPLVSAFQAKSLDTKQVIERLRDILPEFTKDLVGVALRHINRRNEELHTGDPACDGLGTSEWQPGFYQVCLVLLTSMNEPLEFLLDSDEAAAAKSMIAAAQDESAKSVRKSIEAHKAVWAQRPEPERIELSTQATARATKHDGHRVKCPSCECNGIVTGEPVAAPSKRLDDDTIVETQRYLPARFECMACNLRVLGLSQLTAAGLWNQYTATRVFDAADYYAPQDDFEGEEPDYNEPDFEDVDE